MKKSALLLSKILFVLFAAMIFFAQKAYANPVPPVGEQILENDWVFYGSLGGIVIIVLIVGIIILKKLRKKNGPKQ